MSISCRALSLLLVLLVTGLVHADPGKAMEAYQKGQYKVAYKEFKKAAMKGHLDSQYNLAVMLYTGKGIPRDKAEAIYWFVKAAEGGDETAQYNLGVLFSTDKDLPNEYPKMDKGEIYFEVANKGATSNKEKAFKWYKMAAEQGHVSAQLNLGVIYNQGIGVKRNYAEAARWYEKAAAKGNKKGQLNLGILYDLGRGVKKDLVKAAGFYKKAAKQGMRDAQYNLGIIYYNGEGGVKQDYAESYAWLSLATEQGSELASIYKEKVEAKLNSADKKTARSLAYRYYRAYVKPFLK